MTESLKKQIEKAQAEMATWTPERRANVVLQGGDGSLAIGQAARATPADQDAEDAERYRWLSKRVVMTDASTPGMFLIALAEDAIDQPNTFLDELIDAGLKS